MRELGHMFLPSQELVQQHMKGCRRQPLLSADDMRYLHQIIIDHTGKVVRWHPVRFHEYLVIDLRRMNHYPSPDHVVEPDFFLAWNFEPYDVGSPGGYEIFHFIRAQRKRISHFERSEEHTSEL